MQGCRMINLSAGPTRLVFPRNERGGMLTQPVADFDETLVAKALRREAELGYMVPSGRYWEHLSRFDAAALRALDAIWLAAAEPAMRMAG
jgi:hypothetical protein